jgi:hypothetical protein
VRIVLLEMEIKRKVRNRGWWVVVVVMVAGDRRAVVRGYGGMRSGEEKEKLR